MYEQTTITAIATPPGNSGIAILRLSGQAAFSIAGQVFRPCSKNRRIEAMPGYTGALGRTFDQMGDIDDTVIFVYRAPKSYTGEDVVELCCHGGRIPAARLLDALVQAGATLAGPGEFTKRAFLAGKLSLDEAEGVMDLITSASVGAARTALSMRDGALYREISHHAQSLIDLCAHLSAWVDYPEEDIVPVDPEETIALLHPVAVALQRLCRDFPLSSMLRTGIDTAIVGRPNVGKSTLMNLLSGRERSIVTDIPGTTRDVVEDIIVLGDLTLRLSDTAGLRDSADPIERIGVTRSRERLMSAQLILYVLDGSAPLCKEDKALFRELTNQPVIAILNKSDLGSKADLDYIRRALPHVVMSAKTGEGKELLIQTIAQVVGLNHLDPDGAMLLNERQLDCTRSALVSVEEAVTAIRAGVTWDAVSVLLEQAVDALLTLTGERASAAVIDRVFENFCVGK